ncbi:MAG: N-acetyltransferase [Gammaproteobacteria bacterium]|nr:N-acetyltransferase [Gammaproteobacteria bacterium]
MMPLENPFIHESAIVDPDVRIGDGSKVWHFSHIMSGASIGVGCVLGQNVFIGSQVQVGDRCKIQNNVSVVTGVTLANDVFCGPSAVFTNVLTPRCGVSRLDEFLPTVVEEGVTIGANSTIVCGVTLGRYCFIGAGSVVTKSVTAQALVIGNPAHYAGWMCVCGERLDDELLCHRCASRYRCSDNSIQLIK